MTMTIERPTRRSASATTASAAQRLRTAFAAVRVSFTWLGVHKTLSTDQKAQAAESFGAEGQYLSAAKKLLDTSHEAYQPVSSVRNQIVSYWKGLSLPYPEPGVRLIKQDEVQALNERMGQFREELNAAVENLDRHFESLKAAARERLGSLYNPSDYPASLTGLFAVEWDFPSVEPPEYLLRLNPHLYQQERERISARFDEAVKLAEEAFISEFSKLVSHLTERLSSGAEGERKIFRDTAITNLTEFFQRFKSLNVRSSTDLDRLVETARQTLQGADPNIVRNSSSLRQHITSQLSSVQASLDQMLVDQPRRRILRSTSARRAGEVPA
jgi:HAMP domain-containing protein